MRENWGVHRPQTGEFLVQTHEFQKHKLFYEVVLYMDSKGFKGIYLIVTSRWLPKVSKTIYVATTGYYENMCNGLEQELYVFDKPMYRQGNGKPSPWHMTLEEACK